MKEERFDFKNKIIKLLQENPRQPIKELTEKLNVNRTFLAGYLKALEDQGYVKLKRVETAKVYFKEALKW